jgi:hypothetical protein
MPITAPRRSGGNACASTASDTGISAPPATPCISRNATSTPKLGASPAPAAATVSSAMLPMNVRRHPIRSITHAAPGCDTPRPIRYTVTTHSTSTVGHRSTMRGSARFAMVVSSEITSEPIITTTRA